MRSELARERALDYQLSFAPFVLYPLRSVPLSGVSQADALKLIVTGPGLEPYVLSRQDFTTPYTVVGPETRTSVTRQLVFRPSDTVLVAAYGLWNKDGDLWYFGRISPYTVPAGCSIQFAEFFLGES